MKIDKMLSCFNHCVFNKSLLVLTLNLLSVCWNIFFFIFIIYQNDSTLTNESMQKNIETQIFIVKNKNNQLKKRYIVIFQEAITHAGGLYMQGASTYFNSVEPK